MALITLFWSSSGILAGLSAMVHGLCAFSAQLAIRCLHFHHY